MQSLLQHMVRTLSAGQCIMGSMEVLIPNLKISPLISKQKLFGSEVTGSTTNKNYKFNPQVRNKNS